MTKPSAKSDEPAVARNQPTARRFWGIFTRKERWGFSRRGWLALLAFGALIVCTFALFGHPFLAKTERLNTKILVVEGWVHEYAARAAAEEFRTHNYEQVFTTGGPVEGLGGYVNDFQTSASVGADLLKKYGVPAQRIQMVPSRVSARDRTYMSAIALRNWFREHQSGIRSINVLTEDAHARRTQLLFQKAFGSDAKIGIISLANPDYDARHWWRYSAGVREILGESVAYIYARFFFHPETN